MPGYNNVHTVYDKVIQETVTSPVIQAREAEYKHNIVKSEDTPFNSILSHVEGSSWFVDYYGQMLGSDQEPTPYDINQSTVNQQYHLIYSLELKLQSQDMDTDAKTNKIGVNGTAIIYAGVIPNFGDVIISDIGDGMAGRLTVKNVTKKTYMKDTVYEIDYMLVEYINTKDKEDHLNSFVVKKSVFDRDVIKYGSSPVLLEEDYNDKLTADDIITELVDDYLKEFFSNEVSTLEVPGYNAKTYDPYVVAALLEVVSYTEHPLLRRLIELNVNEIKEAYSFSIWPVLIDPSINKIKNIWKRAGPVSYTKFHVNPYMHSFRYSGFNQCMSPVEDLQNVDYYDGWAQQSKVGTTLSMYSNASILSGSYGAAIGEQLANELANQNKVCCHHLVYYHEANPRAMPIDSKTWLDTVHLWVRATGHWKSCGICGGCDECCKCDCDDTSSGNSCPQDDPYSYVLPSWYWDSSYLDDPYCSLVRRYLKGDHIPLKEIFTFVNNRQSLTPKDRFYQMMVMLIILKSTIRSI